MSKQRLELRRRDMDLSRHHFACNQLAETQGVRGYALLLVMSVGHVLKPKLVVGRVWLVAEFMIDEIDNGTLLIHIR